jgi:hypothetical protein
MLGNGFSQSLGTNTTVNCPASPLSNVGRGSTISCKSAHVSASRWVSGWSTAQAATRGRRSKADLLPPLRQVEATTTTVSMLAVALNS